MLALIFLIPKAPRSAEERLAWLTEYRSADSALGSSGLSRNRSGNPAEDDTSVDFKAGVLLARISAAQTLGQEETRRFAQGQLKSALGTTTLDEEIPESLETLETTLRNGLAEDVFEWGLWTETGRLAAAFGATDVLDSHWRRRPKTPPRDVRALNPSVEASLDRIEALLSDGAQEAEVDLLAEQFEQLNAELSSPLAPER